MKKPLSQNRKPAGDDPHGSMTGQVRAVYFAYIWHGFFLAVTMSMLDLNTVFPALVSELTASKALFGLLYSIMLGAPLIFNLVFSHVLKTRPYKKKYLLLGIYMRSAAFLGMALSTWLWGVRNPKLAITTFFAWVFLFSISAGFAGIAYADVMGKVLAGPQRTRLYAVKQFFGSVAAFGGGFVIAGLFKPGALAFPDNFALSLGIGFVGLAVASIGFYGIREPMSPAPVRQPQGFLAYVRQVPGIIRADKTFRRFILIENLASFSVMALPFYMLYAKESFDSASEYLGPYLLVQVTGTVLSSFVWGRVAARAAARVIVRSCIFMGAAIPLVALVLIRTNPVLYGIVFFLVGFIISGRRIGFEPYLLDIAPEENRTEYLGIRGSLNILAVILPFAGGLLISRFGYGPTFALVSAIMVLAGILAKNQAEPTVLP
ncbi:MAG: MFS transporter [Clostridiaceae bacterium]|nr:MFS transporter [Clostridiaceae bacterium]